VLKLRASLGDSKVKGIDSSTADTYDGEAKRVRKLVGENTRFIYGIGGQLVSEYDGSSGNLKKEYISGGITIEPTAVNSNGTQYATGDQLGSLRVITTSSGSVVSRHDYMPFGEELGASVGGRTTGMGFSGSGDNNRKKFTGYERDTETGLDFAQARFYGSTQGRFTSPDPFSASAIIADPQTFNRYAYCRNNPVNSTDPTGMAAAGPMALPSGERVNAAQGMIDQVHQIIQQDEAAWEQRVRLAFLGVHQNESITVFISDARAAKENSDDASSEEDPTGQEISGQQQKLSTKDLEEAQEKGILIAQEALKTIQPCKDLFRNKDGLERFNELLKAGIIKSGEVILPGIAGGKKLIDHPEIAMTYLNGHIYINPASAFGTGDFSAVFFKRLKPAEAFALGFIHEDGHATGDFAPDAYGSGSKSLEYSIRVRQACFPDKPLIVK
jgi:RHS repeat-associated protein